MILIAIWIGLVVLCVFMAKKRGRNRVLAGVLGFFFGIFAVIGYWLAGETEERKIERIRKAMAETERV